MLFDSILVTTDLSQASTIAFDLALYQAKAVNGRITLLSVLSEEEGTLLNKKDQEEQLNEFAQSRFHQTPVTPVLIHSKLPAAEAILNFCENEVFNLIVLSSHGKTADRSIQIGSVAKTILHHSSCPVLLIPNFSDLRYSQLHNSV